MLSDLKFRIADQGYSPLTRSARKMSASNRRGLVLSNGARIKFGTSMDVTGEVVCENMEMLSRAIESGIVDVLILDKTGKTTSCSIAQLEKLFKDPSKTDVIKDEEPPKEPEKEPEPEPSPEPEEEQAPAAEEPPAAESEEESEEGEITMEELMEMNRDEMEDLARDYGIDNPTTYKNKQQLAEAILAVEE